MTQEEFRVLFEEYFEEIRRYIFFRSGDAALSTDIAQETFLKVWEKQLDMETGKDVALLYSIAGNLMISHFRREKVARRVHSELELELKAEDHEDDIYARELKESYRKALMKMNDKHRVVFLMSRVEQLSYREISQRLGIGTKAVEKRMNRALKFLRKELDVA